MYNYSLFMAIFTIDEEVSSNCISFQCMCTHCTCILEAIMYAITVYSNRHLSDE